MRTLTALSLIFTLAACGTSADSAAPVTATAEAARVSPQDLAQLQAQVARLRAEIRAMEAIVSPRDAARSGTISTTWIGGSAPPTKSSAGSNIGVTPMSTWSG